MTKPMRDSWDDSDNGRRYPSTPVNRLQTPGTIDKTPKPPGGWIATPGPSSSSRLLERDVPEANVELVTPVASLSKGSSFNPKTPGVPGGWLNTPAPKKSILKVRFNAGATSREESQMDNQRSVNTSPLSGHSDSQSTIREGTSSALPPSPRSPSKSKGPGIRILNAFGKEEESSEIQDDYRSRSVLRVVDAMGREVEDRHTKSENDVRPEELDSRKLTRGELLSNIRRGLDDLVGEFDDIESDEEDSITKARIQELHTLSKEARMARERIQSQNLGAERIKLLRPLPSGDGSLRSRWPFYVMMTLVQFLLLVFVYRLAINLTKRHFLNTYYDPFNPDVHLYLFNSDSSRPFTDSDFSGSWYYLVIRYLGGKSWHGLLHFAKDIPSYFWNLWDDESVSGSVWLPT
ncbi:hypothetical protein CPB84DRAFT_665725 [Gymnopilus junonius]|uniref:Uncharacterized protein n=1 Tax=Gymnopilus junonius TaxID=109634 RepID=A0A9P5TP86_GYMJU|nr:hypothetical protein CPB84DRAFT_665725 [Gymnopilus junonius]